MLGQTTRDSKEKTKKRDTQGTSARPTTPDALVLRENITRTAKRIQDLYIQTSGMFVKDIPRQDNNDSTCCQIRGAHPPDTIPRAPSKLSRLSDMYLVSWLAAEASASRASRAAGHLTQRVVQKSVTSAQTHTNTQAPLSNNLRSVFIRHGGAGPRGIAELSPLRRRQKAWVART